MPQMKRTFWLAFAPFVFMACQRNESSRNYEPPAPEFNESVAENDYSDTQGGISDGGGNAVVCRDSSGLVTSAELLDLYEIRHLNGRTLIVDHDPADSHFQLAMSAAQNLESGGFGRGLVAGRYDLQLSRYIVRLKEGLSPVTAISQELITARDAMRILGPGVSLNPVDDFSVVILPRGCHLEQAAVYRDHNNTLLIVGDIWTAMDDVNKAALLVHEATYREMRKIGATKSDLTRWLVGHVFSSYVFQSPALGIPRTHLLCYFGDKHYVAIYDEGPDRTIYQFLRLDGKNVYSKTTVEVDRSLSPLADFDEGENRSFTESFDSSLMDGRKAAVSLTRKNGQVQVIFSVRDARGDVGEPALLTCQQKN